MTTVTINQIDARNFKSHKILSYVFPLNHDIILTGPNGVGKTTVGEIVSWTLFGVDLMGSQMSKKLSPEPTTYEWDRLKTDLYLNVVGVDMILSKKIANGKTVYYINDIEKTATEYKNFVNELFDQKEFMSIFSPQFFFSQTYQDQRAMVTKYVTEATEKEVLSKLAKHHATPLKDALKRGKLDEVEKTYKGKKKDADLDLTRSKERLKTLIEQQHESGEVVDSGALRAELSELQRKVADTNETIKRNAKLESERLSLSKKVEAALAEAKKHHTAHGELKSKEIDDVCPTCAQDIPVPLIQAARDRKSNQLAEIASLFRPAKAEYDELRQQLIDMPDPEPTEDIYALNARISTIGALLKQAEQADGLAHKIEQAEEAVTKADEDFKKAVTILDAVVAYKAAAGELNIAKMDGMFPGLTINHFTENVTDGERKPDFELCMDDKPYRKLSRGEKIKAELLFAAGMIEASNMRLPVFLDNAESLTSDFELKTQVIACAAIRGEGMEFQIVESKSSISEEIGNKIKENTKPTNGGN